MRCPPGFLPLSGKFSMIEEPAMLERTLYQILTLILSDKEACRIEAGRMPISIAQLASPDAAAAARSVSHP